MLPLAPVLAQLITLGVQDRTEARHVVLNDRHYEAQSTPGARLSFAWRHSDLAFRYSASLLVVPLESASRDLFVFHSVGVDSTYRLRRTTFTLAETTSFGEQNFQTLALSNPTGALSKQPINEPTRAGAEQGGQTPGGAEQTPGGAEQTPGGAQTPTGAQPTPGTVQTIKVVDHVVRYVSHVATFEVVHAFTSRFQVGGGATYSIAGGSNAASKIDYPLVRGVSLNAFANHTTRLDAYDSLTLSTRALDAHSSNGNHATTVLADDTWQHSFNRHAAATLGGGLSLLRLHQDSGLTAYTIFPNFLVGVSYQHLVARGVFAVRLTAFASPIPDQLRGTVDPRVSTTAGLSWSRDRFSASANGTTTVSVARQENSAGAFDGYGASGGGSYRLTNWLAAEAGARVAKQQFQGQQLVPLSYGLFVALAFGYDWKLAGRQ